MKSIRLLIISSLMVVTIGCSTVSYQYDYDPDTNYSGLKTFRWMPGMSVYVQENIHTLNVKRLQEAVNTQLEAKGCKMTTDNPDFLISMHVSKEEKIEVRTLNYGYGGRSMLYGGYFAPSPQFDVYQYEEGTFILDIVDAQSRELIWRGIAQGEVLDYSNPVKRNEKIDELIQEVLSNFSTS